MGFYHEGLFFFICGKIMEGFESKGKDRNNFVGKVSKLREEKEKIGVNINLTEVIWIHERGKIG